MGTPTGIDQSWSVADPAVAARAGVQVVSMYLSWDASKNITPAKVKAYHRVGVAVLLNWESQAGAPLLGAAQGRADATEAVRQVNALLNAVGYVPQNRAVIYFSCDADVGASQISGPIADYYRAAGAICHMAGFGVGAYGEADVMDYLASHGITDAEWQTYAWSGGRMSAATDFYQYLNGQTLGGASVDFDRVIHAATLGAWWPPGDPHDTNGDDPLADLTKAQLEQIADAVASYMVPESSADGAPKHQLSTYIVQGWRGTSSVSEDTASILKLLGAPAGLLQRVAAVQSNVASLYATVTGLQSAVKALEPVTAVALDTAAVAKAAADAVAVQLRSFVWGVK